ncbi:hypothetical protein ACIOJD_13765 [Streptomyces sp. NPDC088116]|uniref:hypothetical protein n=1 Tax=Streptomyces sp. NPDC088116 TaxID=3365825 RepID=UPI0038171BB8
MSSVVRAGAAPATMVALGLLLAVAAGVCYDLYTVFAKKPVAVAPAAQPPGSPRSPC